MALLSLFIALLASIYKVSIYLPINEVSMSTYLYLMALTIDIMFEFSTFSALDYLKYALFCTWLWIKAFAK